MHRGFGMCHKAVAHTAPVIMFTESDDGFLIPTLNRGNMTMMDIRHVHEEFRKLLHTNLPRATDTKSQTMQLKTQSEEAAAQLASARLRGCSAAARYGPWAFRIS